MLRFYKNVLASLVVFVFIFVGFNQIAAQEKQYMFKRLDKEDGLSNNNVNVFLRDSKGFLWVGTSDGLNRYDGYSIKNFRANPNDSNTIINNIIYSLAEDYNQNIWIGSGVYLDIYNPRENIFYHVDSIFNGKLKFEEETKWSLKKDRNGNYWYTSSKQGLYKYLVKEDSLIRVLGVDNSKLQDHRHQTNGFSEDSHGNIWCVNYLGKIYKINNTTCRIVDSVQLEVEKELYSMEIYIDLDDDLWCYDRNNNLKGVYWVDGRSQDVKKVSTDSKLYTLNSNIIKSIEGDTENKIWIGTDHGGINIIDKNRQSIKTIVTDPINNRSLAENTINTLYKDYMGFIWVGSYKKGISYHHNDLFKFDHYKIVLPNDKSSRLNDIDNFVEDEKGNLWIGTNGAGIVYFDRTNNTYKQYKHDDANPNSISANVVIGLTIDSKNNIWIGTYFGGLNKWDGKKFTHYKNNPNIQGTISDDRVWDICEDSEGLLWIATLLGGVNVFDPEKERVIDLFQWSDTNSIKSNVVFSIIQDSDDLLWFATVDGLRSYNKNTKTFEYYNYDDKNENSLSDNTVFDISEDTRGYIWVATSNGLNILNKASKKFIRLYKSDGLVDNRILTIAEDDHGKVWVSTSGGLSSIEVNEENGNGELSFVISNFDYSDGLQGIDFNEKSVCKTSSGELLFGGGNGFNFFHPDHIIPKNYQSNIVFTDFLLYNESYTNHEKIDGRVLFQKDISYTQNITLHHNENLFTIEFANLNFFHPEKRMYEYQMLGFNDAWLETSGDNRKITYTNLDAGAYTFSVRVSNSDGTWDSKAATINITILPPWWRKWWFRLSSVFGVAFLISSFVFWRFSQLNTQKKLLTEKVEERTKELRFLNKVLSERQEEITLQNDELNLHRDKLEHLVDERTNELENALKKAEESDRLKSSFLANMSHEIRTPMNAIVGFSHLIRDQKLDIDQRDNYIDIIHKNCNSLVVLIDDILDFSKIEANQIIIENEPFDILELLAEIEGYYKLRSGITVDLIYEKPIEYEVFTVNYDALRVKQVVQNLLNNALKFTEKGYVKFGLYIANKQIIIYVEDTGIGIDSAYYDDIFRPFRKIEKHEVKFYRGAGLGLAICKRISELMGGELNFESEVGKGTRFYFTLPLDTEYAKQNIVSSVEIGKESEFIEGINILVVEDEQHNFLLVENSLLAYKVNITWAKNGQEAVDFVKAEPHKYQVILMDIKMPILDGIEAFDLIRKINNQIPAIAVTAYAYENQKNTISQHHFSDYISKPYNPMLIIKAIEKAIGKTMESLG